MNKVALLQKNPNTLRWEAVFNGVRLCQSSNKHRVIEQIETGKCTKALMAGITQVSETPSMQMDSHVVAVVERRNPVIDNRKHVATEEKPHFPVNDRFKFLEDYTDMVITGAIPSLLVTGDGGLGKSFTVMNRFNIRGLRNAMAFLPADGSEIDSSVLANMGDYIVIKGSSTAKGLYRALYENRESIVVFDDCDKVLEDKTAIMILKAALDSTEKRVISWNADMAKSDNLPKSFEFKGGCIFISNKRQCDIDQAIKSRAMRVDLTMTVTEKLDRMAAILPSVSDYCETIKNDALNFLIAHASIATDLNMRTLINICKIRKSSDEHEGISSWEQLAKYAISA